MHKLILRLYSTEPSNEHHREVDSALAVLEAQKIKVYTTYVRNTEKKLYVFKTASKDLDLFLGALSDIGRFHLARLFEEDLKKADATEMVVFVREGDTKGVYVTVEKNEPERMYFVLSSAN